MITPEINPWGFTEIVLVTGLSSSLLKGTKVSHTTAEVQDLKACSESLEQQADHVQRETEEPVCEDSTSLWLRVSQEQVARRSLLDATLGHEGFDWSHTHLFSARKQREEVSVFPSLQWANKLDSIHICIVREAPRLRRGCSPVQARCTQ